MNTDLVVSSNVPISKSYSNTMQWIFDYQLFLFDLDGLLVDTEGCHYKAYVTMCARRGFTLPWDFATYFTIAQKHADAPRDYIYEALPGLKQQEPNWSVLYAEKKAILQEILTQDPIPLLPGVENLLRALEKAQIKRCVVTHSAKDLVAILRKKNPILDTIPHWFTRDDYDKPKPAPDGYLKAINVLAQKNDTIIGFEDSQRGMEALIQTSAKPVLVNSIDPEVRTHFADLGVVTCTSFETLVL